MKSQFSRLSGLMLVVAIAACQPNRENSETKIVDHSHEGLNLAQKGSLEIAEADYALDAKVDAAVLAGVATDVRGRIYLPKGEGPFPVLVYLHGNHGTCGIEPELAGDPRIDDQIWFTTTGSCVNPNDPKDDKRVESPSHLGYAYSAQQMASWGYVVVSVNANLGITAGAGTAADGGLVAARGALVLKHLAQLRQWSNGASGSPKFTFKDVTDAATLQGKLDMTEVGLMGHSRGGEGVRQAYNIYQSSSSWKTKLPDLKIKGIFEIGPVDFGTKPTSVKVEARGTAWAVLLGGCDGDVSNFMGAGPYARMLQMNDGFPKAVFAVWGANHNFFNTEWQVSDAPHACLGTQKPLWAFQDKQPMAPNSTALHGLKDSWQQQEFAKSLMFAFFRANVGKKTDSTLMDTFDSQYALPSHLAQLAPTSREIIRVSDSKLIGTPGKARIQLDANSPITSQSLSQKITGDDKLILQSYWTGIAEDEEKRDPSPNPADKYKLTVRFTDQTFLRNPLILESPKLSQEQTVTIPFTTSLVDSNAYWTIDAAFAHRTQCLDGQTNCQPDTDETNVDVALVYADGSNSAYVHLSDYVKLENYHDTYLQYLGASNTGGRSYDIYYEPIPLLYSLARFELTDFSLKTSQIKGLRLKFPAGQAVSLAVDDIRLVKRPAAPITH